MCFRPGTRVPPPASCQFISCRAGLPRASPRGICEQIMHYKVAIQRSSACCVQQPVAAAEPPPQTRPPRPWGRRHHHIQRLVNPDQILLLAALAHDEHRALRSPPAAQPCCPRREGTRCPTWGPQVCKKSEIHTMQRHENTHLVGPQVLTTAAHLGDSEGQTKEADASG